MKNRNIRILAFLLILIFGFSSVFYAESNTDGIVYVIPLREEITKASERYVQISIEEAERVDADHIVFELDTYGGLVDSAEKIKNYILNTDIETTCFIDNKAESAGVLLAISCDNIYMDKYGTIGSAETIPNTEKVMSMWKSMLRNVAQNQGRNPKIIEAMADSETVVEGLSKKGKLLNLTSLEAEEHGISDGIAENLDGVLEKINASNAEIKVVEEDWSTRVAKIVSQQWVSSLLLVTGFVGLTVEFFIPGFGIPGILAAVSFFLFFGSNILVGNASWFSLMFFIMGAILIIIELFIPGFGLPGIAGIILTIFGLATSMQTLQEAFTAILIALLVGIVTVVLIFKYGLNSRTFKNITLNASIRGNSNVSAKEKKLVQIGDQGRTLTVMRPYGFIQIGDSKLDASAESNYIKKDVNIEVIDIKGNTIIVKEMI